MALLTKQRASLAGTVITAVTPSADDWFLPDEHSVLDVNNASGGSTTVTIDVPGNDVYNQARPNIAIVVAAGTRRRIGLGPGGYGFPSDLASTVDGFVHISTTPTTSVTVAVTD